MLEVSHVPGVPAVWELLKLLLLALRVWGSNNNQGSRQETQGNCSLTFNASGGREKDSSAVEKSLVLSPAAGRLDHTQLTLVPDTARVPEAKLPIADHSCLHGHDCLLISSGSSFSAQQDNPQDTCLSI